MSSNTPLASAANSQRREAMTVSIVETIPCLDLYGAEFQTDPHGVLKAAREQNWCAQTPIGLAVLRYDEVQALLRHRKFRAPGADLLAMQGFVEGPIVEAMQSFLLS